LLGCRDCDPRFAVLQSGGHVERADRAKEVASSLGRFNGEQPIEKRPDSGARGPRDDRLGQCVERPGLMGVEEYANGAGGLLPRPVDDAGIRQVSVDRVLRLAGRGDDEAGGDAAYECLEGCASRDGVGLGFGCRMKRERPGRRRLGK